MPISINAIRTGEQTFEPEWNDQKFKVTYRPDAFTGRFQADYFKKINDSKTDAEYLAWWMARVVVSWEVAGEDGQILPLSEEWLATQDVVPESWFFWLQRQINGDRNPLALTSSTNGASPSAMPSSPRINGASDDGSSRGSLI